MNEAKQLPRQRALLAVARGPRQVVEQRAERRGVGPGRRDEVVNGAVPIREQPIPPALGVREHALLAAIVGAQSVEQRADRLGIHVAHQSSDVLFLAPYRFARLHPADVVDRLAQALAERQLVEQIVAERDQRFTELLQGMLPALLLAFAGLCSIHRLSYRAGLEAVSVAQAMNEVSRSAPPSTLAPAELETLVRTALDAATREGVDQAEVAASHDTGLSATARLGDVENLEYTNDRGVWITVYRDSRKGSASTSDTSAAAIAEAVKKACSFAAHTAPDPHSGLADAELMCNEIPDLDLDHPWDLGARDAIDMAIACEATGLDFDGRINNSEGATVSTSRGARAYGNTHGFLASFSKTSHSVSCVLLGEVDGDMQRDYYYTAARDADDLEALDAVATTAARRTVARLGAQKLKTTRVPVLYTPELARGFIGHAIAAITGSAQYRRSSFLLDAAGEKIFPDFVQIQERPHLPKGMASAPYDAEGVATFDRDVVAGGVLQGYVLSSYSARRLGLKTTANAGGPQNLIVSSNAGGREELIREMGTGLLVEELIGQGVNGVTGDYSRGAVGQWIEGGEIKYPVHEITIAGNLRELYQRIERIGDDRDLRGGIRCGSLLVGEMTVAGA